MLHCTLLLLLLLNNLVINTLDIFLFDNLRWVFLKLAQKLV